jgi:hypothetical protein
MRSPSTDISTLLFSVSLACAAKALGIRRARLFPHRWIVVTSTVSCCVSTLDIHSLIQNATPFGPAWIHLSALPAVHTLLDPWP